MDTSKFSFENNLATFCDKLSRYEIVFIPFAWLPYVCSRMAKFNERLVILSYDNNQFEVVSYKYWSENDNT